MHSEYWKKNSGYIREGGLCWKWPLKEGLLYMMVVGGCHWPEHEHGIISGINICKFSVLTLGKDFPFWCPCRHLWLIHNLGKNWMFLQPPILCYCTVWCDWPALLYRGRCSFHIVVLTITYPFIYIVSSFECRVSYDINKKNIGTITIWTIGAVVIYHYVTKLNKI